MDSILYGWDDLTELDGWIGKMEKIQRIYLFMPVSRVKGRVASSMFGALIYRMPFHRSFNKWLRRAVSAARSETNVTQRMLTSYQLISYFIWSGDFSKAKIAIEQLQKEAVSKDASPLSKVTAKLSLSHYYWLAEADYEACHKAVSEGLKLGKEYCISIWDNQLLANGAQGALTLGKISEAYDYLKRMNRDKGPARRLEDTLYHDLSARLAVLNKDLALAMEHAKTALQLADEIGVIMPQAVNNQTIAVVLAEQGEYKQAIEHLTRSRKVGRGRSAGVLRFSRHLIQARIYFLQCRKKQALNELNLAMSLGREQGLLTTHLWQSSVMAELCVKALEAGVEVEYAQNLIRKRKLVPEVPPLEVDDWPWPVKVYTLGRFSLEIDGKPLQFTGKAQQKPLDGSSYLKT